MSNTNDTIVADATPVADASSVGPTDVLELTPDMVVEDDHDPMLANPDAYFSELTKYKPTLLDHMYGAYYNTREKLGALWTKFQRSLPRLIWYGQEVDVLITFTKEKFSDNPFDNFLATQDVQVQHQPDGVGKATAGLLEAGVGFDVFLDGRGRTWCFDYSLSGPVRVKFIGKAKAPLKRKA